MEGQLTKAKAIVAYNKDFVIGVKNGGVPWSIREEMLHFKKSTIGHPVIMGRKTWETLPEHLRPLPERINVIVSRSVGDDPVERDGAYWLNDIGKAVASFPVAIPIIIGGEQIYRAALKLGLVSEVIASEVKGFDEIENPGSTFPDLRKLGWRPRLISEYEDFDVVSFLPPED